MYRSDYIFAISRETHNYIFYAVSKETKTYRVVTTTLPNGTKVKENVTDTKTDYQLYMIELILTPN